MLCGLSGIWCVSKRVWDLLVRDLKVFNLSLFAK